MGFSQEMVTRAWETARELNSTLTGAADAEQVTRTILQKQMTAAARDQVEQANALAAVEELLEELQLDQAELQEDLERVRQEQTARLAAELMAKDLDEQQALAERAKAYAAEMRKRPGQQAPEDALNRWKAQHRPSQVSQEPGGASSSSTMSPAELQAEKDFLKEAWETTRAAVAKADPGGAWKQVETGVLQAAQLPTAAPAEQPLVPDQVAPKQPMAPGAQSMGQGHEVPDLAKAAPTTPGLWSAWNQGCRQRGRVRGPCG